MYNDQSSESGSGSGSGCGSMSPECGAGVGTGCGYGGICPKQGMMVTLKPGVYVVTHETSAVIPKNSCLVEAWGNEGRGSGNGESITFLPDARACESLITTDKEEAEKYFSEITELTDFGCSVKFGDGSGMGRGEGNE